MIISKYYTPKIQEARFYSSYFEATSILSRNRVLTNRREYYHVIMYPEEKNSIVPNTLHQHYLVVKSKIPGFQ